MSVRWWLAVVGLLGFLLETPALAHPEHVRDRYEIKVFFRQKASEVEVLVRTPLYMFQNFGLPIRGAGYIDLDAFDRVDPHAEGDATYAERAANAVNKAFTIYANGNPVSLTTQAIRVAAPDDSSFENYKTARQKVQSGDKPPDPVKYDDGYIDTLFETELLKDNVDLYFQPGLPGYGEKLTMQVHYIGDGETERVFSLHGDGNRTLVSRDIE